MKIKKGVATSVLVMMMATGATAQVAPPADNGESDIVSMIPVEAFGDLNVSVYPDDGESDPEYYFEVPGAGYIVGYPMTEDGEWVELKPAAPVDETGPAEITSEVPVPAGPETSIDDVISEIQGWDSAEDRALALELVLALEKAQSPEEMNDALIGWRERNAGKALSARAEQKMPGLPADVAEDTGIDEVLPNYPVAQAANIGSFENLEAPEGGDDAKISKPADDAHAQGNPDDAFAKFAEKVHGVIESEAFWFSAGQEGATPVYMMIDPECPHCATIISKMTPDIQAGKIQLRIVMMPLLSAMSLDRAAEILTSENPQKAVLDHAQERVTKGFVPSEADFDSLPQDLQDLINKNVGLFRELQLPGVPVTSFKTDKGYDLIIGDEGGDFWDRAVN